MDYNVVIVRFGEMSTKGKNKRDFVFRLAHSIRLNLRNYENDYEMIIRHDHIYLNIKNKIDNLVDILKEISGMYSFSLALKIDPDFENVKSEALRILKEEKGSTFKIHARRIDKSKV